MWEPAAQGRMKRRLNNRDSSEDNIEDKNIRYLSTGFLNMMIILDFGSTWCM